MEKNKFTHGSLFSGIGGPEIAAEEMGWKNMFHCEINPFGRKILDYWFPNSKSYEDITKTNFTEWRGKINVLTGGFPCQPFSCAGQRKGAEDDRYLWPEMLRAIREIQPDWVVGENVAGILSMVQPGSETALGREESLFGEVDRKRILHRQEYVVETVCNDLEREGYFVQPVLIIQGIRAAESAKRAEMSKQCTYFKYYVQPYGKDKNGKDKYHTYRRKDVLAFRKKYADDLLRPVFDWSAQQVIDYILENGIQPNPLYRMGYKRVGCFPCVMASQQDIYNISVQEPERISYIAGLEQQFNSSFFGPDKISSKYYKGEYPLISDVVRYVQSKRAGGSLFDDDVATSCMSYYGLCE